MVDQDTREMARRLARMERRLAAVERADRLTHASVMVDTDTGRSVSVPDSAKAGTRETARIAATYLVPYIGTANDAPHSVWLTDDEPLTAVELDIWLTPDTQLVQRQAGQWVVLSDSPARDRTAALRGSVEAQDGRVVIWDGPTAPTLPVPSFGDLWLRSDANHNVYRWESEAGWVPLLPPVLNTAGGLAVPTAKSPGFDPASTPNGWQLDQAGNATFYGVNTRQLAIRYGALGGPAVLDVDAWLGAQVAWSRVSETFLSGVAGSTSTMSDPGFGNLRGPAVNLGLTPWKMPAQIRVTVELDLNSGGNAPSAILTGRLFQGGVLIPSDLTAWFRTAGWRQTVSHTWVFDQTVTANVLPAPQELSFQVQSDGPNQYTIHSNSHAIVEWRPIGTNFTSLADPGAFGKGAFGSGPFGK